MAKKDDDLVAEGRKCFERCRDKETKNRQNWLDDVRFARLGEQWPQAIRAQREREGRPCLTLNRLPSFIKQVTNDARQNTPSIKFHPVGDGADQETARIYDGIARNIQYSSNADVAYDNALDNAVCGGFGYFRVSTDYAGDDTFDQDIRIEEIKNPLSVYGDPMSSAADSADWNECFVTEMWDRDAFKKKWPKAELVDFEADSHDSIDWFNEDEVRVCEWWRREEVPAMLVKLSNGIVMLEDEFNEPENQEFFALLQPPVTVVSRRPTRTMKVTQYLMSGCEILETNEWAGKYIPIVPVYGDEVMVDGERHFLSLVRFAKDPQQMLNFWRTASTELVALAPKTPFIGAVGQFATDAVKWANANSVSYPYIEYDAQEVNGQPVPPPQRQPFAGPPAGALQEAMNAQDDMKSIMGIYDASLGARSNETSGRAILARQREGDTSTFNFTDNLSRAIRHAGRILCDLIPKVYSGPRMMRVIHEDGSNEHVPVNGMAPPAAPPGAQPGMPGGAPQQPPENQLEQQAIARVFDLTAGKYDVTCETGPSYNTKREEASGQMIEFMRAVPQAAGMIGDLLAKNLDWPGADKIAERLAPQGQNPQAQAAQQQMQQMQQQMQQMAKQLEDAQRDKSIEGQKLAIDKRKAEIDGYKAETDRMSALGLQASPEYAAALGMQVVQSALNGPDITPGGAPTQQQPFQPQQPQLPQQMMPPPAPQQSMQAPPQPPMPQGAPPEGMM